MVLKDFIECNVQSKDERNIIYVHALARCPLQ